MLLLLLLSGDGGRFVVAIAAIVVFVRGGIVVDAMSVCPLSRNVVAVGLLTCTLAGVPRKTSVR